MQKISFRTLLEQLDGNGLRVESWTELDATLRASHDVSIDDDVDVDPDGDGDGDQ